MSDKKILLNDEQKEAVFALENTVVSAGAGSGKTSVLAARVIYLLTRGHAIDSILVLTFTNKAAAEMQERILKYLSLIIKEKSFLDQKLTDKQLSFLKKQQEDFNKAQISTIDSFFQTLSSFGAKEFACVGNVGVSHSLLEEAQRFVSSFMLKNNTDEVLKELIKNKGIGFVENVFTQLLCDTKMDVAPDFMQTHVENLFKHIKVRQEAIIKKANKIKTIVMEEHGAFLENKRGGSNATEKYYNALVSHGVFFEKVIVEQDINLIERYRRLRAFDLRGFTNTKVIKESGKQESFKAIKDAFIQMANDIYLCEKTLLDTQWIKNCYALLQKILDQWIEYKKENRLFSYANITQLAQYAIEKNDFVKKQVLQGFSHIIVDEVQDNSKEQNYIFKMLKEHKRENSLCCFFVGDVKQSIYAFRGADVYSFLDLQADSNTQVKKLQKNYRSNSQLIDFFNAFFDVAFSTKLINYDHLHIQYQKQETGRQAEADIKKRVFVHRVNFVKNEFDSTEQEAMHVVKIIKQKIDSGVNPKDIAILARRKKVFSYLRKYLLMYDIAFEIEAEESILQQDVGKDFYLWLSLLVFPEDKVSLAAVLRGPIANVDDNTVFAFLSYKRKSFKNSSSPFEIPNEMLLQEEYAIDIARIQELEKKYFVAKKLLEQNNIQNVLDHFWLNCAYRYVILREKNKHAFLAQFNILKSFLASEKEVSINEILRNLKKMVLTKGFFDLKISHLDTVNILSEQGDSCVKIMTVYAAKGLEFPVVIFCDMGSDFRVNSADKVHLIDDCLYIDFGFQHATPQLFKQAQKKDMQEDNAIQQIIKENKKIELAEELRLLYVACTRAEEEFYVIYTSEEEKQAVYNDELEVDENDYLKVVSKKKIANNIDIFNFCCEFMTDGSNEKYKQIIENTVEYSDVDFEDITQELEQKQEILQDNDYSKLISKLLSFEPQKTGVAINLEKDIQINASSFDFFQDDGKKEKTKELAVDTLLKKHGLYAEFGTLCHFMLRQGCELHVKNNLIMYESLPVTFEKQIVNLNTEEKKLFFDTAQSCANNFFMSDVWTKTNKAKVFCELPLSLYNAQHKIQLNGAIDLIILEPQKNNTDYTCHIIDFKTNLYINIEKYKLQLAAYKLAIENIISSQDQLFFGNKIHSITNSLFYLRNGTLKELYFEYSEDSFYIECKKIIEQHQNKVQTENTDESLVLL